MELLRGQSDRIRSKVSVTNEALVSHAEVFLEYDTQLVTPSPANPWISDEEEFWLLNDDWSVAIRSIQPDVFALVVAHKIFKYSLSLRYAFDHSMQTILVSSVESTMNTF